MKNRVFVGKNYRSLRVTVDDYVREHREDIERVKKNITPFEIKLKNGDILTFVSYEDYPQWCKGRTYYDWEGKEKVHSGRVVYESEV